MEKFSKTAEILLNARYFMDGEDWARLAKRIGTTIAQAEKTPTLQEEWTKKFTEIIQKGEFIPASPFLMNAGGNNHLFSCYVLPIEDSLTHIYKTLADAAKIFQVAGGVGYDFSSLRPKGCFTTKSGGISSGPLSFMQVFNASCNELKAGGRRKGAQMGTFRIDHPDIEEFINIKQDLSRLTNFNLSITITDTFMQAVRDDLPIMLQFEKLPEMDREIQAKVLWNQLIHSAWKCGEPGILFIDRINRADPIGGIVSTNPCSELPLPPYGCCDLGSINLSKLFHKGKFNWKRYEKIIKIAIRFLDDAIDANYYTLPQIKKQQLAQRRIGLGIMGLADALIKSGVAYDSPEGCAKSEEFARILKETSKAASEVLAIEKSAFPAQNHSKIKDNPPIRNATRTTLAPTGSISIIAGCSAGIEPIYALIFERRHDLKGYKVIIEVNQLFLDIAKKRGFYSEELIEKIKENKGSCQGIDEVPKDVQDIFKIAADIHPNDHINQLITWQKFIDSSISKTINLAATATEKDIEKIFWTAYEGGCKGITVFRDGCRGTQVLSSGPRKEGRPDIVDGKIIRIPTSLGKMYITVGIIDNKPFEVFVNLNTGGTNAAADAEALGRMISLALRTKVSVLEIVKQLKGIGAGAAAFHKGRAIMSIPDAIAFTLEEYFLKEKVAHPDDQAQFASGTEGGAVCKDCDN